MWDIRSGVQVNSDVWCKELWTAIKEQYITIPMTNVLKSACISISGAQRNTIVEALQVLLHLPPIDYIVRETAKISALRLKYWRTIEGNYTARIHVL